MDADYNVEKALSLYPYPKINAPRISAPAESSKWTEQVILYFFFFFELLGGV